MRLIEQNQDKIAWWILSRKEFIFEKKINFEYKSAHLEEIVKRVFHPNNIELNRILYNYDLFDEEYVRNV
jgi:hypothetical protein